jgi:signal transduction histidine kinase
VSRKEGQETRIDDITIFPLTANGVEGAVIRVDDVTERVRMEEVMVQSEKMLTVGGLAAGMAHEINNPLAGMLQTAGVMADRLTANIGIPANQRAAEEAGATMEAISRYMDARGIHRMLDTIITSGRRVADIIDNMLSFARKSDEGVVPNHIEALLDKTLKLAETDYGLKKDHDFKRIKVIRKYADNIPLVPCQSSKIQQVFLNIFRNGAQAMQAAETEHPQFLVRTYLSPDGDSACVEIADNGPGMDEATRKKVFEPFFTTKTIGMGTGLGLSVSYFIITENHGGKMDAHVVDGGGTRFIIQIPKAGKQ